MEAISNFTEHGWAFAPVIERDFRGNSPLSKIPMGLVGDVPGTEANCSILFVSHASRWQSNGWSRSRLPLPWSACQNQESYSTALFTFLSVTAMSTGMIPYLKVEFGHPTRHKVPLRYGNFGRLLCPRSWGIRSCMAYVVVGSRPDRAAQRTSPFRRRADIWPTFSSDPLEALSFR